MTGRRFAETVAVALAVYVALEWLRSGDVDPRAHALKTRRGSGG